MSDLQPRKGTSATRDARGCDTVGMLVMHRMLRRQFGAAPQLVRDVPPGDTQRADVVGRHVSEFTDILHNHHATEDDSLFEMLEARSPACALHVAQMKAQHQAAAAVVQKLRAELPAWQETADAAAGEKVAAILEELNDVLNPHMGQEEGKILPVASTSMSQREWDAFGKHAMEIAPKDRLLIQLGYALEPFTPEERTAWMKASIPAPVRALYRVVGRRQFESDYLSIYGTVPA